MSRIITFRGLLADDSQERILLKTKEGLKGYRINKFELMPHNPGFIDQESVIKIYTIKQTVVDGTVDFSESTLLGAGFVSNEAAGKYYPPRAIVVFEDIIFNQDIYITHKDLTTGIACNYYIELEAFTLDLNESTVATLKNLRNTSVPG